MLDARFSQLYFDLSLNTLHRGLPAIAGLLVDIVIDTTRKLPICIVQFVHALFRRQHKEHFFREAWTPRSVTSDMRRLKKTYLLTYLLTYCVTASCVLSALFNKRTIQYNAITQSHRHVSHLFKHALAAVVQVSIRGTVMVQSVAVLR